MRCEIMGAEMDKTRALALIKKMASFLLVLCFVLPLSRCTEKVNHQGQVTATDTYLYGFNMAKQGWDDIKAEKFDGVGVLLAVFNVFFVPIICLRIKERLQAVIYFFSALVSGYILYGWVFLFSTSPQIGGVIAVISWALLFCASSVTILDLWRSGGLFKRGSAGT